MSSNSQMLKIRRDGAVLVLSNNNVAARNAFTAEFYSATMTALLEAETDPSVGAVVLTGEGGHFCAGGDLHQISNNRELPELDRRARIEVLHELIRRVRDCPKPVIAAVEGAAAGAGFSLALACDMMVAAKNAVFSAAYVKVGLTPDGGATFFLAEFLSRQVLTEFCLTGERISGERLYSLGSVNRLVEPGQAEVEAIILARLLADGPQQAMALIKTLCRKAQFSSLEQQLELEATYMVQSQKTKESLEGVRAFLEKRLPDYTKTSNMLA